MKRLFLFLIVVIITFRAGYSESFDWNFGLVYREEIAYIHALENYNFHPLRQDDWEKNLFRKHGVRSSFGSIKSDMLLVDTRLNLNLDLGNNFWFRLHSTWNDGEHRDVEKKENLMGFEKRFWESVNLFFLIDPVVEKEKIDAQVGFMLIDDSQEQYFRLAYVKDEFMYDSKNDWGGTSRKEPNGIRWQVRYGMGNWHIFSEGKYSTGFERSYPDAEQSPELSFHTQQVYDGVLKFYAEPVADSLLEVSGTWYHFSEEKRYQQDEYDYLYANDLYDLTVRYVFLLTAQDRIRFGGHYLVQDSSAERYKNFDYSRREILPFLFYERLWRQHTVELGYIGTIQQWDYAAANPADDYSHRGYADKVKLGWTYAFKENAYLQLSVSHQIAAGELGGGNAQVMMLF